MLVGSAIAWPDEFEVVSQFVLHLGIPSVVKSTFSQHEPAGFVSDRKCGVGDSFEHAIFRLHYNLHAVALGQSQPASHVRLFLGLKRMIWATAYSETRSKPSQYSLSVTPNPVL